MAAPVSLKRAKLKRGNTHEADDSKAADLESGTGSTTSDRSRGIIPFAKGHSHWHTYYKIGRSAPRVYTARDIGRLMCRYVQSFEGRRSFQDDARFPALQLSPKQEIEQWFEYFCPQEKLRQEQPNAQEMAAVAVGALSATNEDLLSSYRWFLIINGLVLGLLAFLTLASVFPGTALAAVPTRAAVIGLQTQVASAITVNIFRRAANDAAIRTITMLARAA